MHPLLPAENRAILDHVVNTLSVSVPQSARINVANYAFDQAPLFVSLFVLSYEAQAFGASASVDFNDKVTYRFQRIIANQLLELERDHRFFGYGRALALLGRICAMEGTDWPAFSEETMVAMAEFFAKSSNQLAPTASVERYPRALSALIHRKVTARGVTWCQFNHDVIAELGLAGGSADAERLRIDTTDGAHEVHALLDHLIERRVAGGVLLVWEWLSRSDLFDDHDAMVRLLMTSLRLCADTQFSAPLMRVLGALPSATLQQQVTDSLLSDTNLLVQLGPGIGPFLTANRGHPGVKAAAHAILTTENFAMALPKEIVSHALNILGGHETGRKAANAILATEDFAMSLPKEIVSHALNILGKDEAGRKAAHAILSTTNFAEVLPFDIVGHALNVLSEEEAGRRAAQVILDTENFAMVLPSQVISHALNILGKAEAGRRAAQVILDTDNFATVLPFEVVSHALKVLADEVTGRAAAATILSVENSLYQLPKEVVGAALSVAEESIVRSTAAIYLLKHANRTHPKLQFAALRALASTQDVSSRETLRAYLTELMNDVSPTAALFRLRHDLLFLPLSWVSAHARLLRWVARRYRPDCATKIRHSVFKILRCRLQFGPQPDVDNEVIELCHNVVRESVDDVDHQRRVDSSDLKFGHIWTAAQILDDPLTTADLLTRLNDYAALHVDIAQTNEFRNLLTILEGRWEPELQATDDFEAV